MRGRMPVLAAICPGGTEGISSPRALLSGPRASAAAQGGGTILLPAPLRLLHVQPEAESPVALSELASRH